MKDSISKLTGFSLTPIIAILCAGLVFFGSPMIGRLMLATWVFLIVCRLGPDWRLSDFFGGLIKKQKKKGGEWPWSQ